MPAAAPVGSVSGARKRLRVQHRQRTAQAATPTQVSAPAAPIPGVSSPLDFSGVVTLEQRVKVLYLAEHDVGGFRAAFNAACAKSAKFCINFCFWINEPRAGSDLRDVPFLLRAFQNVYIDTVQAAIEHDESLLTDKTREMGVTWMIEGVGAWGWLFQRGFVMLMGSMTEDKIDSKNNPNTLFWKFDYLIECLKINVPWLYPEGYAPGQPNRTHMKASNPNNGSKMLGEVMGPNFGRSGRVKVIFLDEFAECASPVSTWAASSRTSNCRLVVFTPKGMNFAGQLANPARGKPRTIKRVTLHWMLDESKNAFLIYDARTGGVMARGHGRPAEGLIPLHLQPYALPPVYPWYEEAKKSLNFDTVLIAQELDVNYNESVEGQMYPQIERARFGRVPFDPTLKLYCSMDYGLADMTALVWFQYSPWDGRFKVIDAYQARGKTIRWYVPFITGQNLALGAPEGGYTEPELEIIARHRAYQGAYVDFFGDPSGKDRNQVTATSVIQELARHRIYVRTNAKMNSFIARKHMLASALPYCDFDEINCAELIQAIRDSRQRDTATCTPVHGPESHFRTAMEFAFVNQPHGISGGSVGAYGVGSTLVPDNGALSHGPASDTTDPTRRLKEVAFDLMRAQEQAAEAMQHSKMAALKGSGFGRRTFGRQSGGWGRK